MFFFSEHSVVVCVTAELPMWLSAIFTYQQDVMLQQPTYYH